MGIDITAYRGLSVSEEDELKSLDDSSLYRWRPSWVPEVVVLNGGFLSSDKTYTYLDEYEFNEGSFSLECWYHTLDLFDRERKLNVFSEFSIVGYGLCGSCYIESSEASRLSILFADNRGAYRSFLHT